MKNKFILSFILFSVIISIFTTKIFAKEIEIQIVTEKEIVIKRFDPEITVLCISYSMKNSERICDIKGLDQFTNLSTLEIPILNYVGDFDFLADCKNLKELFLNGGTITSFKFLEKLESLEYLELSMYINKDDVKKIYSEKINFENLNNIKDIRFSPIVNSSNKTSGFGKVPNFINIQNKPKIYLGNNEIKAVNENDIGLLNQYSEVYLFPNPILENSFELEKFKNINLNYM